MPVLILITAPSDDLLRDTATRGKGTEGCNHQVVFVAILQHESPVLPTTGINTNNHMTWGRREFGCARPNHHARGITQVRRKHVSR
ncbi:MAG TPA: hypothetical protein VIY49_32050 [Bryobacteraceae bacterium]